MMNIVSGVRHYATSDRLAVVCDDEKLSYKDLDRYSDIIANYISHDHSLYDWGLKVKEGLCTYGCQLS